MDMQESIKSALDLAKQTNNTELVEKLINIQQAFLTLQDENKELINEIKSLEKEKKKTDDLVLKGDCYYIRMENGELNGPYCPSCLDKDEELNKMHINVFKGEKHAVCNICYYQTVNF